MAAIALALVSALAWGSADFVGGTQGKRVAGIGVQFSQDESGAAAKSTIEKLLGQTMASSRPTHTM